LSGQPYHPHPASPDERLPAVPAQAIIFSRSVIESFPGHAFVVDRKGTVLPGGRPGPIGPALAKGSLPMVATVVREVLTLEQARYTAAEINGDAGPQMFQIVVLPLESDDKEPWALVLARNDSLGQNFQGALVDSRQRYKDLVECSSDFAWETDADGAFTFVSPVGTLGFTAASLIGRTASTLFDQAAMPEISPFTSIDRIEAMEVAAFDSAGNRRFLSVSSLPLKSRTGSHLGNRGVWRDVTREREQETALIEARRHEASVSAVVSAIHAETDRTRVLHAAAAAAANALQAAAAVVFRRNPDDSFVVVGAYPEETSSLRTELESVPLALDNGELTFDAEILPGVVCAPTRYAHATNGSLCLAPTPGTAWSASDRRLIADIAAQLGTAIEQTTAHENLQALSRTDPLTGLFNRRAFLEEAERRLGHAIRYQHPLSALYLDLNNFKAVNDLLGHRRGDTVLQTLARLLKSKLRDSDLAARIGGDEFVLILEETDMSGAMAKAQIIAESSRRALASLGTAEKPLGVAIGVAVHPAGSEGSLDLLLEAADAAMYRAKTKGGFSIDPAPEDGPA